MAAPTFPDRPLAETYWHHDFARGKATFPPVLALTAPTIRAMVRARAAHADSVGRRVVVSWDGHAIWYWLRRGTITWYVVTDEQDHALLAAAR